MNAIYWRGARFVFAGLLSCYLAPAQEPERAAVQWFVDHAIPITTAEPGSSFADLEELRDVMGDARVLALGEATHGTREFFQLKHRLLEYAVTELGFSVFAIEATMPEAFEINRYVLTGEGDPGRALAGLYFWTWDTEEVLALIQWMRRYNADPDHDRKLKFYGVDMQHPMLAFDVVVRYLQQVAPDDAARIEVELGMLGNPFTVRDLARLPEDRQAELQRVARDALGAFSTNMESWSARNGTSEWRLAEQHARLLVQYLESSLAATFEVGGDIRDRAMAENLAWILDREGPGAKAVVWAHNFHAGAPPDIATTGRFLRERFEKDLVTLGFAFDKGEFQALAWSGLLETHRVGPSPAGSVGAVLAETGLSMALFDLRAAPASGPAGVWFESPHGMREMGAGFSAEFARFYVHDRVVPQWFDLLLFVEDTTAARANPWVRIQTDTRRPTPANLDFEDGAPGEPPPGWRTESRRTDFEYTIATTEGGHTGRRAAVIRAAGGHGKTFGGLKQEIEAAPYRDKRLTLRAAVRTDGLPGTKAYLWMMVWSEDRELWFENMADRPITASDWTGYEIVGIVPENAEVIDFGVATVGSGSVWVDSVALVPADR